MTMPPEGWQSQQGGWGQPPAQGQQYGQQYGQPGYSAYPGYGQEAQPAYPGQAAYPSQVGYGQQPPGQEFPQVAPEPTPLKMLKYVLIGLMVLYVLWAANQMYSYVLGVQMGLEDRDERLASGAGTLTITFGVFMALVGLGLYVMVFLLLRARKDGGRITGIVFALLGLVAGLINLLMSVVTLYLIDAVLTAMYLGVTVWWLVLAFNGQVQRYLRAGRSAPQYPPQYPGQYPPQYPPQQSPQHPPQFPG